MPVSHAPAVYSYTRFSTGEQRKGTGQQRQDKLAAEWCTTRGFALATNYSDLGVSAFKGKNATHGALARFLACVESGVVTKGSVLIVESLDRLSRQNVAQALQLFLGIINGGVSVVTLCDGKEYSTHKCEMTDLMMSLLIFARANDESRMKSQRKAASWQHKRDLAREGKPLGGKPPSWLRATVNGYEIIEPVAQKLRTVFADYVNGLGTWKLYQKHKLPCATVGFWLNSPAVMGDLVVTENGQKVTIKGHYPRIINAATWRKAQQMRSDRYINRRRGSSGTPNLFAGLLFDAKGGRFDVTVMQGRRLLVCPGCVIDADKFDNVMVDHVLRQQFIRTRHVETDEADPRESNLAEKLAQLQATMAQGEDPAVVQALMPVVRHVTRQLKDLEAKRRTTVVEQVSYELVGSLLSGGSSDEDRLQARDIIRETVQ